MRKRLFLVLAVVCIAAVFAGVFAGCNNDGKGSGGNGSGAGDVIFTEDASLDDINAALEKAESLTFAVTRSDGSGWTYHLTNSVIEILSGPETIYYWREGGVDYYYETGTYDGETVVDSEKNLEQIYPELYYDTLTVNAELMFWDLTTDEAGNIVVNPEEVSDYVEGSGYVKLSGSSIEWGYETVDEEGVTIGTKIVFSGVNATTADVPGDIKALEKDIEWAEWVSYNDVEYSKAEDENGDEYYYVSGKEDPNAVPVESINTLPVRKK